ncbi:hypothetical protein ASPACDRAFT_38087 [Aspergillus aculeatus ATCC 16872]|uniref:Uncharacterized protein n=1 Tax=Aspergillus aculeatus (strain ATCC 16872 / CBS 172.66 / WB 5094) TaxID=690307 RepID=A0A1L9X870_ASPA1|nr:uncharacterized protein ASPACDRAFT_38087 [Aspergillus aculeatus ATCC 16872]OJK04528.1 hypothetical protein ASPACDRAFT_38087 [Aspergillus aculeatus ATCC 16872]
MEATLAEDKMEMASPYQGHVDDFDIDIDIMEDQASTTDKDMMIADDFPEPSNAVDHDLEGARDADMTDDIAERTMDDAEDAFAEEGYNIEMQYGSDRDYEAEMLEDDYDEDIDAPVTDVDVQPSFEQLDEPTEQGQGLIDGITVVDGQRESRKEPDEDTQEQLEEQSQGEPQGESQGEPQKEPQGEPQEVFEAEHDAEQEAEGFPTHHAETHSGTEHLQEPAADHLEEGEAEESYVDANEAEHGTADPTQPDEQGDNATQSAQVQAQESHFDKTDFSKSKAEGEIREEEEVEDVERQHEEEVERQDGGTIETQGMEKTDNDAAAGQHTQQPVEQTVEVAEHEALYPVKVYYQETEISLFPPREGDSSETFFLEDESLAYGSFAKLLEACRNVLREHVSDREVLIMDVDALNLQFVEDSMHMDKITLFQVVDLYLRLCHNEGIDEPEPLYLSLSTRLTLAAELSDLLAVANEGKGLTDIHAWDSYAEAEAVSAELYEGLDEVPYSDLPQEEDYPEHGNDKQVGTELPQEVSDHQQDHDEHHGEESIGDNSQAEVEIPANGLEDDASREGLADQAGEAEFEVGTEGHAAISQHPDEASYHSEQSESSATVTQLPPTESVDEQQAGGGSASVTNHQPDEAQYEYNDIDGTELDETFSKGNTQLEGFDSLDEVDQFEPGEIVEAASVGPYEATSGFEAQETHREQISSVRKNSHTSEKKSTASSQDHVDAALLDGDDDAAAAAAAAAAAPPEGTEAELDESFQDETDNKAHPTMKSEDESTGAVDNFNLPSEGPKNDDEEVAHADEFEDLGHFDNEAEQSPLSTASHDNDDDLNFGDDYFDLDLQEDSGAIANEAPTKAHIYPSTKRHREPEDEVELIETPSPDAKRSRSS